MNKFISIHEFVQTLFSDEKTAQQASQIIAGIMAARSPRLSEIAAQMPGEEAACYKRIQRFIHETDPQAALKLLFNKEAGFVIGDPTEIERPHARKSELFRAHQLELIHCLRWFAYKGAFAQETRLNAVEVVSKIKRYRILPLLLVGRLT